MNPQDETSSKNPDAINWWKSFSVIWDQVITSYLEGENVSSLDNSELAKLQQRLQQLFICLEEKFHTKFDCNFADASNDQEGKQRRIKEKEEILKELIENVQELRSSSTTNVQDAYENHYNESRKKIEKCEVNQELPLLPNVPSSQYLNENLEILKSLPNSKFFYHLT